MSETSNIPQDVVDIAAYYFDCTASLEFISFDADTVDFMHAIVTKNKCQSHHTGTTPIVIDKSRYILSRTRMESADVSRGFDLMEQFFL